MKKGFIIFIIIVAVVGLIYFKNISKSSTPPLTSNQTALNQGERDAFVNSIIKLNKARDLSNDLSSGKAKSQEETENEMFVLTQDAIDLSKQVSDSFLDLLHPELKIMYREKLIRGSQMWLDGTKDSYNKEDIEKQITGSKMSLEWINWFEQNSKSFEDKIFK